MENNTGFKEVKSGYRVEVEYSDEDEAFIARIPSLPGCVSHGETEIEAFENVKEVGLEWLEIAKENNWPIPDFDHNPDPEPQPGVGRDSFALAA